MAASNFANLPEKTKEFLSELDEKDISDLWQAVELYRSIKTVGRFVKWVIVTSLATFLAMISLGDAVVKAFGWWKGSGR